MRVAVDTNVLAYAEGLNAGSRKASAVATLRRLERASIAIPVQVLGELFNVLVRKAGLSMPDAQAAVTAWSETVDLIPTSPAVLTAALELARSHRLNIWDAVILAAAADGECRLLLSEDLHDGFVWSGVTVVNPFAARLHPLLAEALAER